MPIVLVEWKNGPPLLLCFLLPVVLLHVTGSVRPNEQSSTKHCTFFGPKVEQPVYSYGKMVRSLLEFFSVDRAAKLKTVDGLFESS